MESYLRQQVKALGGACEKHTNPGYRGDPDRLVSIPFSTPLVCLVETKWAEGVEPEEHQLRRHEWWRSRGMEVYVVRSKAEVDEWLVRAAFAAGM